jgi:redox-sensing transcriptional repressor
MTTILKKIKESKVLKKKVVLSSLSLFRLTVCYQIAVKSGEDGLENISSAYLAKLLKVDETLIRKDMSIVGIKGKPKVGYPTGKIISVLEETIGISRYTDGILIGCGSLGSALLRYPGFAKYGLRIMAAFDIDHTKVGRRIGDYPVLPMEKCKSIIETFKVQVAILAVPAEATQEIADWMVGKGIKAIWNFAPVILKVPQNVVVRNENLTIGLAQLIHQVSPLIAKQKLGSRKQKQ